MTSPWLEQLQKTGEVFQGGQGHSYAAVLPDGTKVFVKVLKHQKNKRARARFAREAAAYETLEHPGLPAVLNHNAHDWRAPSTELYLALEFIEGETLAEQVRRGTSDLRSAVAQTIELLKIMEYCHVSDIVHRDLKPANIVIAKSGPKIVDFGLSFNAQDSDTSDLTRVNEEVGNRFLRLPEHSTGGRSPVGDLTQLAGVLLYLLTGVEPRVLLDEEGLKPHQRTGVRDLLSNDRSTSERKLLSVFDLCFDPRQAVRPQTARHLIELLEAVVRDDEALPGVDELLARLDEVVADQSHTDATKNAEVLSGFVSVATTIAESIAAERGLDCSRGGGPNDYAADPPFSTLRLGYATRRMVPSTFVEFRFELRAVEDVVMLGDGDAVWRGPRPEGDAFRQAIVSRVVRHYIDSRDPGGRL